MSKLWEVTVIYDVIADTEEEVWKKWASGEDVTYNCIEDITEMYDISEDEDEKDE